MTCLSFPQLWPLTSVTSPAGQKAIGMKGQVPLKPSGSSDIQHFICLTSSVLFHMRWKNMYLTNVAILSSLTWISFIKSFHIFFSSFHRFVCITHVWKYKKKLDIQPRHSAYIKHDVDYDKWPILSSFSNSFILKLWFMHFLLQIWCRIDSSSFFWVDIDQKTLKQASGCDRGYMLKALDWIILSYMLFDAVTKHHPHWQ